MCGRIEDYPSKACGLSSGLAGLEKKDCGGNDARFLARFAARFHARFLARFLARFVTHLKALPSTVNI